MRGQLLILAGLLVALAAALIYMGYVAWTTSPFLTPAKSAYGYTARDWPSYVDLASTSLMQEAKVAAASISTGLINTGLYANHLDQASASRWWPWNYTQSRLSRSLLIFQQNFLPLGAAVFKNQTYFYAYGFNGTLGLYPQALQLHPQYSFTNWQGRIYFPGGETYRILITVSGGPYSVIPFEYVVTYVGHVADPSTVGERYNTILGKWLTSSDLGKQLYILLVDRYKLDDACSKDGDITAAFQQLPWWSEVANCPFCILHIKLYQNILMRGYSTELLVVYYPLPLSGKLSVLVACPNGRVKTGEIAVDQNLQNNPREVFKFSGLTTIWFADDLKRWSASAVKASCWYPYGSNPTYSLAVTDGGPIGVSTELRRVLNVSSFYKSGTKDWGVNVYMKLPDLVQMWSNNFAVESLMRPASKESSPTVKSRFNIYSNSDPSTTHDFCARVVGMKADPYYGNFHWHDSVRPTLGIWDGDVWENAGSVSYRSEWYFLRDAYAGGNIILEVYRFLGKRALELLGRVKRAPFSSFGPPYYVVLGSQTEDDVPRRDENHWVAYAYVRLRPWIDPPPAVSISPLDMPPLALPVRVDIVASSRAYSEAELNVAMSMSFAQIQNVTISRVVRARAEASARLISQTSSQDVVEYVVMVYSNIERGSLAARFRIFYSLGWSYINLTCPVGGASVSAACSAQLVNYWGYDGAWDKAQYRVVATLPKYVSHALLVDVAGVQLALSTLIPDVRYFTLDRGQYTYIYAINEGNGTAVYVFPWSALNRPVVVSPNDGVFGAVMHIDGGSSKWSVVLVPPKSTVVIALPKGSWKLEDFAVPWQRAYTRSVYGDVPPCANFIGTLRVYFPGVVSGSYVVFLPLGINVGGLDIYRYDPLQNAFRKLDSSYYLIDNYNALWVYIEYPHGKDYLTHHFELLVLCSGNSRGALGSTQLSQLIYLPEGRQLPGLITAGSVQYPEGFSVIFDVQRERYFSITNDTQTWGYCYGFQYPRHISVDFRQIYYSPVPIPYWWYDGFCYNWWIWQDDPGQSARNVDSYKYVVISVMPALVYYRIVRGGTWIYDPIVNGQPMWFGRGHPNVYEPGGGKPLVSFNALYPVSVKRWVVPASWPPPYIYRDWLAQSPDDLNNNIQSW